MRGHVPSWHLTKRAEQAQCRAGTWCRAGTVGAPSRRRRCCGGHCKSWLAQRPLSPGLPNAQWPLSTGSPNLSTGLPNGLLVRASPTSFDGSPNGSTPSAPPAAPAQHRSPRQGRDSSQQKKCRGCRLSRQPLRNFFQLSCGPLSKVSANLPGTRTCGTGELHAELHAGNSEKMGHACFQFRTPRGQQPKNGWCLFPVPRHKCHLCFPAHSCPAYQEKIKSSPPQNVEVVVWGEDLQLFLPMAARPQLPGIEARPRLPFALHRGRFSDFALASDFARKILRKRCGGERVASGVGFHPENPITGPAPKVCQRCCKDGIADGVFFHHSHALPSILVWAQDCPTQSWRGHRIAPLNPGVGTGLPHSILVWAQDCPGVSQKTLEAQCCTALRPQTRRPDCAENTGSASVHTDALPDSPPGFPASNLASNAKEMGKIKLFPTRERIENSSQIGVSCQTRQHSERA